MNHEVNSCPLRKLKDGLLSFHEVDDDAIQWLQNMVTAALVKLINKKLS